MSVHLEQVPMCQDIPCPRLSFSSAWPRNTQKGARNQDGHFSLSELPVTGHPSTLGISEHVSPAAVQGEDKSSHPPLSQACFSDRYTHLGTHASFRGHPAPSKAQHSDLTLSGRRAVNTSCGLDVRHRPHNRKYKNNPPTP